MSDVSPVPGLDATLLLACMRARSQLAPRHLVAPGPDEAQQRPLFEAAATAPDHGRLLPWRFVRVGEPARERLAGLFELALLERDPRADADERQRARDKARHAPWLALAVARVDDAQDSGAGADAQAAQIPAHERLVSLGCALQNLLLCARALGFSSGLVSGQSLQSRALREGFGLAAGEMAVCFVAVGTPARERPPRQRPDIARLVDDLRA